MDPSHTQFWFPYDRPPPWYEFVATDDLRDLAQLVAKRLRVPPPYTLDRVIGEAYKQVRWFNRFGVDDLKEALTAVGISIDGTALIETEAAPGWEPGAMRMLLSDIVEAEERVLRIAYYTCILSEEGKWLFFAHHEGELGAVMLEPRVQFDGRGVKGGWD